MRAEAAGEQAIAERNVDNIPRPAAAARIDRAITSDQTSMSFRV